MDFVMTVGEDKRIFADFVDLLENPADPSPAPTITIQHPTAVTTGPSPMTDDTGASGRWFYDLDTVGYEEGKHPITVQGQVGTFTRIEKFSAYVFATDVVDEVLTDLGISFEAWEFDEQEELQGLAGRKVYVAWRSLVDMESFVFDWNQPSHYDVAMCRAEILLLEDLKRRMASGAITSEFTVGIVSIRSGPGRSPINQIDDILADVRSDCRRRSADLFGSPVIYKRWAVVKFRRELTEAATAANYPSEAWWRLYGGNAP